MSVKIHDVKGYDDYQETFRKLKSLDEPLFIWYVGAKVDGQSWCGDCSVSEPVIMKYLNSLKLSGNINVLLTEVEREDFKGPDCKFRSDKSINLTNVPTLYNPSRETRLVEMECTNTDKLDSFFSDVIRI